MLWFGSGLSRAVSAQAPASTSLPEETLSALKASQELILRELASVKADLDEVKRLLRASGPTRAAVPDALPLPREPVSIVGAPVKGDWAAPVAIVAFQDFQCPYCAAFVRDTLPVLELKYVTTGKLLLAFRNLPLVPIHSAALLAAVGAECAADQSHFWEMHDVLFADPGRVDDAGLRGSARMLGLDSEKFTNCLHGGVPVRIAEDAASAQALGISSTPTFLIGALAPGGNVRVTRIVVGARPVTEFAAAIEPLLSHGEASEGQSPLQPGSGSTESNTPK
jgi:protein-disulfide isomerase